MTGKDFKPGNYCPPGYVYTETYNGLRKGDWRIDVTSTDALKSIYNVGSNNYSRDAKTTSEQ